MIMYEQRYVMLYLLHEDATDWWYNTHRPTEAFSPSDEEMATARSKGSSLHFLEFQFVIMLFFKQSPGYLITNSRKPNTTESNQHLRRIISFVAE